MLAWLVLLLLCGAVRAAHPLLHTEPGIVEHVQRAAAEYGNAYLPVHVSPSSPCGRALSTMANALQNITSDSWWAATMVDSWGKIHDGALLGSDKYSGFYDECLAAASPDGSIKGKHCWIRAFPYDLGKEALAANPTRLPLGNVPQKLLDFSLVKQKAKEFDIAARTTGKWPIPNTEYGTCMPNVCTAEELQISFYGDVLSSGIIPIVYQCDEQGTVLEFTDADVGFMSLITFLLVLIICASLVDIYLQFIGSNNPAQGTLRYLLVFSAYTNLSKMFQVNTKPAPGTITCLHAMRTLSMTWVIWCHQQTVPIMYMSNVFIMLQKYEKTIAQTILNGFPSVDTFFFLSGLLVSYSVLREVKRKQSFNILVYYFHRILRLVPAIGIACGFIATVLRFFVAGPLAYVWNSYWQPMCAENFWKDVSFVNNFISDGSCLGQTWYIAADMQMFIVGPLVILPLYFWKGFGRAWLLLVTIVSAIIPAAITYVNDFPPTLLNTLDNGFMELFFKYVYLPPWTRASPWLIGIWVGYIFFKQGNTRYKMKPLVVTLGWILATITGLLVVFGMASYNHFISPMPYDVITSVTYGGLHRLAWGAAVGWVVFACHNGYGGIVNEFLSHPVWQPISRLTYTTYLVAMPLQYLLSYNIRGEPVYFTHAYTLISTVGGLIISLPCAVLLSLMAESPIVGLEKLLLRPNHGSSPRKPAGGEKADSHAPSNGLANPAFTVDEVTAEKVVVEVEKIKPSVETTVF